MLVPAPQSSRNEVHLNPLPVTDTALVSCRGLNEYLVIPEVCYEFELDATVFDATTYPYDKLREQINNYTGPG